MAPSGGCVLAFDFGLKHLGVAVGQTVTRTASPLTTLRARQGIPDWQELTRLVDEWSPQLLVVGLPLNMDGTESEMAGRARAFAAKLGSRSNLPVVMDEDLRQECCLRDAREVEGVGDGEPLMSSIGEAAGGFAYVEPRGVADAWRERASRNQD